MINVESIKERYLKDELSIRLGGLAANLARIRSIVVNPASRAATASLIEESKYFIEWAAPEAPLETQVVLVEIQLRLAQWEKMLGEYWDEDAQRQELSLNAKSWSDQVLELSGLLN